MAQGTAATTTREQLLSLAARCEAASGPDRAIDRAIGEAVHAGTGWVGDIVGLGYLRYSASLDAALSLYKVRPDRIPTDPLKACAEALRQW